MEKMLKFKKGIPTKAEMESLKTTYEYDNHKKGKERFRAWGSVGKITILGEGEKTRYSYINRLIQQGIDPLDKNIIYKKDNFTVILTEDIYV